MIIAASILSLAAAVTIFNQSLRLFLQINSYKSYWQKQAKAAASENSLVYIALGDSAAQGVGGSSASRSYVGILAERVSIKTGRPVHVINLSVSGAKVEGVLNDQLPRLANLNLKPDIITLEIGANDMNHYEEQNFKRDFVAVLSQLPKNAIVADIAYFGSGRHKDREPNVLRANQVIRQTSTAKGFETAPLHKTTLDNDSPKIHCFDLFHPSDYGYQIWADAFWGAVEARL